MKKLVPDPPRAVTVHTRFSACDGHHSPLFAVCAGAGAGADVDKALAHLVVLLRSAYETNLQACDAVKNDHLAGILWATQHTLEASRALAESMMRGIAEQASG